MRDPYASAIATRHATAARTTSLRRDQLRTRGRLRAGRAIRCALEPVPGERKRMSRSLVAALSAIVVALVLAPAAQAHGHGHGGPPHGHASFAPDSLRESLTRERFYFLMPDRFANGDTSNDRGGLTGPREVTGFDPTRKGWYHGGDLTGMTSKLDYIKGLGTTAIWLTPSFKNKP